MEVRPRKFPENGAEELYVSQGGGVGNVWDYSYSCNYIFLFLC